MCRAAVSCAIALVAALCSATAVARPHPPERLPIGTLTTPNPDLGGPPSLRSGVEAVEPCTTADRLRPAWRAAAAAFGLRWQIVAAITKIESGFGCNMGPSSAGAVGWTQFLPSTWERWGMDADGDGDADPHNSVDAVFSTARYLRVTGAPQSYRKAIFSYNHADWYVRDILSTAREFGDVSEAEMDAAVRLAERGRALSRRLADLQEGYDAARAEQRTLRRQLAGARRRLQSARRDLGGRQREFAAARDELNDRTSEYVQLTRGLQGAQPTSSDEDGVLSYVSQASDPQEALLVYQAASGIMLRKTRMLDALRGAAARAQAAQLAVQKLVTQRETAVADRDAALARHGLIVAEQAQALDRARRALRALRRTEQRYERLFGSGSSLAESPFASGLRADAHASGKLRWPISGTVTSKFNPNRCLAGVCRPHEGVDLAASVGDPVRASASGRVNVAALTGGYGNYVCVDHGGGVQTCYAHLSRFAVHAGDDVEQGQIVGRAGCTGRCFGPHLHFEVRRDGKPVDPLIYLP